MNPIKKIGLSVLVVFVAIQFIQPVRNKSSVLLKADISKILNVPDSVQTILKKACYDCHSNNTVYPWYINIQPIGWLMSRHISQGKAVLNFSEFANYSARKRSSKLTGIANSIKDDNMPLSSYKLMHKNGRLSKDEKACLINWIQQLKQSYLTWYW
jgi:hypothetical protein